MVPDLRANSAESGRLAVALNAMTQKEKILSALAKYGKRPADTISLKELTVILTMQTRSSTPALTPDQVKYLYKLTDRGGSNSAPCELIAATWSHEPLDRALIMRNTFRTCDFDQSGAPRLTLTNAHAHRQARSSKGRYGCTYCDYTHGCQARSTRRSS